MDPKNALKELREGNMRFSHDNPESVTRTGASRRRELVDLQAPFAAVVGCSDSRVPPELIFDQALGDLFVIRVAGNVITPAVLGSLEFAVGVLNTSLIVVLGHSNCGAVQGALEEIHSPSKDLPPGLGSVLDHIIPVVREIMGDKTEVDSEVMDRAVRANTLACVEDTKKGSSMIRRLNTDGKVMIIGAEYKLDTGKVEFLWQQNP